jgi:5-formyltetrahydrofolate cyclo-ligase
LPYRSRRGRSLLEGGLSPYRSPRGGALLEGVMMLPKSELRSEMRRLRKRLADLDAGAAGRAAEHADALPGGALVAVYRAAGSELDTDALARALVAQGRGLCLPVVIERDARMLFRRWVPGEPLELDLAGMAAPLPLAEVVEPDLIVTPLLAFDRFGGRLGQGGGYYDRTFAALAGAIRVGFAYAGQEVERLPVEPHDMPLHGVLTEAGYRAAIKEF